MPGEKNRAGVVSLVEEGENPRFPRFLPATAPKKKRTRRNDGRRLCGQNEWCGVPHQHGQARHQEQKQPDAALCGRPSGGKVSHRGGSCPCGWL